MFVYFQMNPAYCSVVVHTCRDARICTCGLSISQIHLSPLWFLRHICRSVHPCWKTCFSPGCTDKYSGLNGRYVQYDILPCRFIRTPVCVIHRLSVRPGELFISRLHLTGNLVAFLERQSSSSHWCTEKLTPSVKRQSELLSVTPCSSHQRGKPDPEVKVRGVQRSRDELLFICWSNGHQVCSVLHAVMSGLSPALPGQCVQLVAAGAELSPAVGEVTLRARVCWRAAKKTCLKSS